ncbi:MAG: hypothetical protein HZA14_09500 [Nitrospirae bacterium]|nr:hypothetical protein [Nitrospirota bacterium]
MKTDRMKKIDRQLNTIRRHSRLSGIGRLNMLNTKKDSGQAGMTEFKILHAGLIFYIFLLLLFFTFTAYAQEDAAGSVEKQKLELAKKEELIKQETERLKALKKEVEDEIARYSNLLQQIEKSLQLADEAGAKRLRHVAKAYEAMAPEDAAQRLAGLDNETAVQILLRMESKKAGLVIGMMESRKATLLTKEITKMKL